MESPSIKVAFIGPACVGKTSLIFCQLNFTQLDNRVFLPTLGVSSHNITVRAPNSPSGAVSLHVFDTAGQERFGPMQQMYYRDIGMAVLCFDPSQADWMHKAEICVGLLREINADCALIAIATKFDLWTGNIDPSELEKTVEQKLMPTSFTVTSAQTGYQVGAAFETMAEIALTRSKKAHTENVLAPAPSDSSCDC
jgi:GTPase SAR1 family protein